MRLIVLVTCLLLAATACHRPRPEIEADPAAGEVAIRIVNHNFSDVVIYLDERGHRSRLGLAGGENTTLFFLPWRRVATGTLRLLGDPVGGSTMLRTDVLSIRAGSLVVWTIESSLAQSNAAVY
ncbi:MAG: hypothetical protein ABI742_04275 [Gemmatimonadota bacterium]